MTQLDPRPAPPAPTRATAPSRATGTSGARPAALVHGVPTRDAAVAVCIPVYQGGAPLAATLASVLAQTVTDIEVVVLDNASTDATAAVLASVDDPRVAVWRNHRTVDLTENFNRVVALSHAPLVKVLPADDLLEPRCLELAVAALADPTVVLAAGRTHLVDERGGVLARARFLRGLVGTRDRSDVVRRVVRSGANPVGGDLALTFRRDAFDAAGGYRPVDLFADVELALRVLEHGRLRATPETVARFRIAPGTASDAAGAADYAAQRAWLDALGGESAVRTVDRGVGRLAGPLARLRRIALFALVRGRAARRNRSTR